MNNEPVAWMFQGAFDISTYVSIDKPNPDIYPNPIPLYTHPVKELTDEEIADMVCSGEYWELSEGQVIIAVHFDKFARAILRKAREQ